MDFRNIVNYLRKSRRDEDYERRTGENTLNEQRKLMAKVLDDLGFPYVQKFEIGSGDKIATRPVFQEVIRELHDGKYDAIAVKEISRLGRGSYSDMGEIYDLIVDHRMHIITPWKIYDPRNNADLRQIRFEMFFAREEFETIRERLVGARYQRAMEGKWMSGKVPFGYSRNETKMKLEPNEDAGTVRLIFDMFVSGTGYRAIATQLKKLGIESPYGKRFWDTTQLRRLITNPAYIGTVTFRTTKTVNGKIRVRPRDEHIIVPDAHEAIVSEYVFYEAQRRAGDAYKPESAKYEDFHELDGLLVCKECGRTLLVNRYRRKLVDGYRTDVYVRCRNQCVVVQYPTVLDAVEHTVKQLGSLNQSALEVYIQEFETQRELEVQRLREKSEGDTFSRSEEIRRHIRQRKKELEQQLKYLFDKHFKGIYSDDDFLRIRKQIYDEMMSLEQLEQENNMTEAGAATEPDDMRESLVSLWDVYRRAQASRKRNEILRQVFSHINMRVVSKGTKRIQAKIELEPVLNYRLVDGIRTRMD